jgi:outer membrane protein assembly factor BamB
MPTPPFHYYKSDNTIVEKSHSYTLNIKSSEPNEIIDEEEWFIDNDLTLNTFQVPNSFRDSTENLPDKIDVMWNELIITAAFYDDSYIYCTYGSDFAEGYILNIYDEESLDIVYTFDFSNYKFSPDYIENDYIQHKIIWAEIKDGILYISHSHNTYAESSNYLNAFVTAIDLDDMSILWRSDALVSNSYNFQILNDIIFCGYGFTAESDFLYQLDINTGEVLDKTALKSAPYYIIEKDSVLFVRTYNANYEFEIIE